MEDNEELVEENEEEALKHYEKAGAVAFEALKKGAKMAKPGVKLLEIADKIEKEIIAKGVGIGFPVNLSINENAAHFTPKFDDELAIGEKDVLKIDVGTQVEGYIGDCALTLDFSGENGKLLEASANALEAVVASIRPGKKTGELGAVVEAEIRKLGFRPIENLTGHYLAKFKLHAGGEIPNVARAGGRVIEEGDVFAIEPFASTGSGYVAEATQVEIFELLEKRPLRMLDARKVAEYAETEFKGLPFAERWLHAKFGSGLMMRSALRELVLSGSLHQYPVLHDKKGSLVSQSEYTVVVEKDGARILTK